jgi:hypothetical protein|eukprot:SAG25_NODE_115_length_14839_cov_35.722524_14_plen_172_part_00
MPPKPTCKVVKREGQGGARIHPKGCQVRTDVKADGSKITKDKAGQRKYKKKETDLKHFIFAATSPNEPRSNWVKMQYDTGASITVMTGAQATKLGYNQQRRIQLGAAVGSISGVGAGSIPVHNLNMSFYLRMRPNDWRLVTGMTAVGASPHTLLGVPHIAALGSAYAVKFV